MTLFAVPAALGSETPGILALCTAMTLALLWYVFYVPDEVAEAPEKTRATFLRERKEMVYENLRDLNFEFKAGKMPDNDYRQMRTSLEEEAAALLAEIDHLENNTGQQVFTSSPRSAKNNGKAFKGNASLKGTRK